jgi:3-keto-disaccharide hydrolase
MKAAIIFFPVLFITVYCNAQKQQGDPTLTEIWSPVPRIITAGKPAFTGAPSDAIVLFGSTADSVNWIGKDGKPFTWKARDSVLTVVSFAGDLQTKKAFGDCQLHVEWRTPAEVSGEGQGRGNSGIFLMSRYELQVLDSYNNSTYSNGQAGSIYKQHMPLVNVCRKPGDWQAYDIIFIAPQFNDDSTVKSAARMTVFQNGVLIQNNVELWGPMQFIGVPKYQKHAAKEPLLLQDHHNAVSFRNIWIREL